MKGTLLSHTEKAMHTIATVDGMAVLRNNQPYIGNVSPDMDMRILVLDWFGDDKRQLSR